MKEYMNIKEVSRFLGIKESTIRYWVFTDQIPYVKLNKLIRFHGGQIEAWISSNQKGENHERHA